ncbi:hypothetical protein [Lutibacter sp.]|uniref:hypothetical protein n=1 Tax=Lutibacter sp. TaxID=1925666 RepID=UPI003561A2FE
MAYTINWTDTGVYVTSYGIVKTEDVISVINTLIADSRFDSLTYILKDFKNVTEFILNEEDLKLISSLTKTPIKWNPRIKSCFVTANTELQNIFYQFIEIMKETKWEMKIFDSNKNALKWCTQDQNTIKNKA